MTRTPPSATDDDAIAATLVAVRQAADAICDRWSLALGMASLQGETRFAGLMARTGMATRLLTTRLRALEASGVLFRSLYSLHPPRHEYRLTRMGEGLLEVILQMVRWEQGLGCGPRPDDPVHAACGARLHPELRCRACGGLASARDIDLRLSRAQLQKQPRKLTAHRRSSKAGDAPAAAAQMLGPSLDIFGDRWGIEVLICAFFRVRRFSDFRRHTGMAANILSDRLRRLTVAGVLSRDAGGYRLTGPGVDLYGVVVAIQDWADAWLRDRYRSPVTLLHRDCGAVFRPLTTCAACGQPPALRDVRFCTGDGVAPNGFGARVAACAP